MSQSAEIDDRTHYSNIKASYHRHCEVSWDDPFRVLIPSSPSELHYRLHMALTRYPVPRVAASNQAAVARALGCGLERPNVRQHWLSP